MAVAAAAPSMALSLETSFTACSGSLLIEERKEESGRRRHAFFVPTAGRPT